MTDFQLLLLILALLYLSECLLWVRRGSVVFRSLLFRRFHIVHPSPGLGGTSAGVVFLNPLPPFGAAFICHQWPLSISADAICSFVPQVINDNDRPAQLGHLVRFNDIHSISHDGRALLINGHRFANLNAEPQAGAFAALLQNLARLPASARPAAIDRALADATSLRLVRRRTRRYRRAAGPVPLYTHTTFLLLIFAAATVGYMPLRFALFPSLAALFCCLIFTASIFFDAHRRLYPRAAAARWRATLNMFLAPTLSIRCKDALSRDLFAEFHPLAVALELCPQKHRRDFAAAILRDLESPMQPTYPCDDPDQRAVIDAFQPHLKAALLALLRAAGEDPATLAAAPAPDTPESLAYCPRCLSQFIIPSSTCSHCGDLPTRPLASPERQNV